MRFFTSYIAVLVLIVTFAGCVTSFPYEPEEDAGEERLLLMQVRAELSGWPDDHPIDINGVHRSNLEMEVRHRETGEVFTPEYISAHGFAYIENPKPGEYRFVVLRYRNEDSEDVWREVYNVPHYDFSISEAPGVYNIGKLVWEASPDNSLYGTEGADDVKERFAVRYEESRWLNADWHIAPLRNNR